MRTNHAIRALLLGAFTDAFVDSPAGHAYAKAIARSVTGHPAAQESSGVAGRP